jgi:hypothetical protein
MKRLIIILICLSFVALASAKDLKLKGTVKQDPIRGAGSFLILNDNGNETGRIKSNPLWPANSNRYLIMDKKGNIEGMIKPDYIRPNIWIIETDK